MTTVSANPKGFRIGKIRSLLLLVLLACFFSEKCLAKEEDKDKKSEKNDKDEKSEENKDEKKEEGKEGDKKKPEDKLKEPGSKEEEKEGGGCNHRLLSNFRLDGLGENEAGSDMLACGNVKAANNCCSKIDEIKIVKSWNGYSAPILDKFSEDMITYYKKVHTFDNFVRELDAKKGRYHYSEYKWHKSAEEKCYDGKYFVSKTGIGKLHAKMDWNHMLAEKTGNFILNHVMEKLETEGLLDPSSISEKVQKPLKKNKDVHEKLLKARPGYGLKIFVDDVEETYIATIKTNVGGDLNTSSKKKEETVDDFLKAKLEIGGTLQAYMEKEYRTKNFKDLQAYTAEKHIEYIIKQVKNYVSKKGQSDLVVKAIQRQMSESGGLKKRLEYFVTPEKLKNKKVWKSADNYILKSITDTMIKNKDVKGNNYRSLVKMLHNIENELKSKDKMAMTFRYNFMPYMVYSTISHTLEKLSTDKAKAYTPEDIKNVVLNLDFDEPKANGAKLDSHSNDTMNFAGHKAKFVQEVEKAWKEAKKRAGVKHSWADDKRKAKIVEKFNASYDKAVKEVEAEIKAMKEPSDQKALVCAVVYHSNLFREVRFNQEKMDYCMSVEADFKAFKVDVPETLKLLDTLKPRLRSILDLKKGFYCSMCNKTDSPFIDIKKMKYTFSKAFCVNIVKEYKTYLEWKNVKFMEYILKMYQYLKCFSDDGTPQPMPFKFFDPAHEAAFPSTKACLEMKSDKEVGNCLDVCSSFDFVHYSPVFDGEKLFIKKVINHILSVVRTHGFQYNRILEAERPGSKIQDRRLSVVNLYGNEENQFGDFEDAYVDDDYFRHSRYLKDEEEKKDEEKKEDEKEGEKKEEGKANDKNPPKPGEKKEDGEKPAEKKPVHMSIYDIHKNVGKSKNYTLQKYYNYNEVARAHKTYNVTEPNIDFTKFIGVVEDSGLDPVAICKASNFDPAVAHMLVGHPGHAHEDLDPNVVRALMSVDDEDVKLFNTGLDKPISEAVPEDEEETKRKEDSAKAEALVQLKADKSKPDPEAGKKKEGEGEAKEGEAGAEGEGVEQGGEGASGGEQPRKLYGKLYRKLYKKKKHRGARRSYRKHSNPFMKAMIDVLF